MAVENLLSSDPPRRVALMDSPWADTVAEWVRQGYPTKRVHKKKGEKRFNPLDGRQIDAETEGEYEEPVPVWEHFGYDMVGVGGWFDALPLRGHSELIEETEEWETRRNGAGAALKYWKHRSGTPEHVDFLMTSREAWEGDYRHLLLDFDERRADVEGARKELERKRAAGVWTHYGHLFIWELMRQSMGDVIMYESLLVDKEWVHDYARVYTDFFKTYYDYLLQKAGKPDGIWVYEDLGYRNGLFTSPANLREMIFPYYAELVGFFHERELPVILHTCGSTVDALELIVEAGFDGLNPMERKARGNDPFVFAERWGDKLLFVGGLDARVFESNDLSYIEREVEEYLKGMKDRGARLVFASDHSISTNTRYASYRHAVDVYRRHMDYGGNA
jgi:uroporphyrinogen decarboxylase